jgi:Ca2+-binding EF-hand superfamily protein
MKVITTLLAVLVLGTFSVNAQEKGKGKKPADPEAMFKKKDGNSDGKVSKEEFTKGAKDAAKAEAQFGKLDKDSSGDLSLEEFKAGGAKKKKAAK